MQHTIGDDIFLEPAQEAFGGCWVDVSLSPADPGTGIVYHTPRGSVKSSLGNAFTKRRTIGLRDGRVRVETIEHVNAALFFYGIDNAHVCLNRLPSKSYDILPNWAKTKSDVMPTDINRELPLCEEIEKVGVVTQLNLRRERTINHEIKTPYLTFTPAKGLSMSAKIDYPKYDLVQEVSKEVTPEAYKEFARARPYAPYNHWMVPNPIASLLARLWLPQYGLSHGYRDKFIWPTRKKQGWIDQELFPDEVALHTIIDRVGAFSLIDGRLADMHIHCFKSNHPNDIKVLRELFS